MDQLDKAYETLGVPPTISTTDLQKFYRELVKRWHPDQFGHDEEEKRVAGETLRDINAAYQHIMQERKGAAETEDAATSEPEPGPETANEPEYTDPTADGTSASPEASGNRAWVLALVLALAVVSAGVVWWQKSSPSRGTPTAASTEPQSPPPQPPAEPGPVIAHKIGIAANDFVVDVWHNGKLVPDKQRNMVADRFGAATEEITLDLREGDWLVFNPVNNRLRWNGAKFFGVAGMTTNKTVAFVSTAKDGRWTYMEDKNRLTQFINERDYVGNPVFKIEKNQAWSEGPGYMNFVMNTNWTGEPVWGQSRNTYIKFVAKPLPPVKVTAR